MSTPPKRKWGSSGGKLKFQDLAAKEHEELGVPNLELANMSINYAREMEQIVKFNCIWHYLIKYKPVISKTLNMNNLKSEGSHQYLVLGNILMCPIFQTDISEVCIFGLKYTDREDLRLIFY